MKANSLNFRELMVLRGNYPLPVKPDVVMGADGAGEIVSAFRISTAMCVFHGPQPRQAGLKADTAKQAGTVWR
jgi:NADPH:quinone reductase-like Zn-dependent oxidoreductase